MSTQMSVHFNMSMSKIIALNSRQTVLGIILKLQAFTLNGIALGFVIRNFNIDFSVLKKPAFTSLLV